MKLLMAFVFYIFISSLSLVRAKVDNDGVSASDYIHINIAEK